MTNRLLKFEKQGCVPCFQMQIFLDSKGAEVEKINPFEQPELAGKYDIGSVPVLVLVDGNGVEIKKSVGFKETEIEELILQI